MIIATIPSMKNSPFNRWFGNALIQGIRLKLPEYKLTNPIIILWSANLTILLFFMLFVCYQSYLVYFGSTVKVPEIRPLHPHPVILNAPPVNAGARNGFDTSGIHWRADSISPAVEELLGVMVMPGVRAALTNNGTVNVGSPLAGGKLLQVLEDRVVVERASGPEVILLPIAHRPTLQSLNSAQPVQKSHTKENK